MSRLRLLLLGPPLVECDGAAVHLETHKSMALLVYLALTSQVHRREELATLFWPDYDRERSLAALRRNLSGLQRVIGPHWLEADRQTIGLSPAVTVQVADTLQTADTGLWSDAAEFQRLLTACQEHEHSDTDVCPQCFPLLIEAVTLYRGEFLTGFSLRDSPGFDEWQFQQAELLRQELGKALERLVCGYTAQQDFPSAIHYAQRWLSLDALHEPAHRQLMLLYAWNGERAAALRQYQVCVRTLEQELGVQPEKETTTLYLHLRDGGPDKMIEGISRSITMPPPYSITTSTRTPTNSLPPHNLPPAMPFVGREQELTQIAERLANPTCRLLTLVGLGGMGKTRLALEVGRVQIAASEMKEMVFPHGVFFVSLAALDSDALLDIKIAEAIDFAFYGSKWRNQSTTTQLLNYLKGKQILLILDNFEHLLYTTNTEKPERLEGALLLISQILAQAPGVKLLVTSREPLHLQEEWVIEVRGLPYPPVKITTTPQEWMTGSSGIEELTQKYTALRLFVQSAQRIHAAFNLTALELPHVAHICHLVEGMPLGIELAAAWVRGLSCREIAHQIAQHYDFLSTSLRDTPTRHHSLRAIFDYSWHLLTPTEQKALRQLSVFRGNFTSDTAKAITRTSPPLLLGLIDKSLLQPIRPGRYSLQSVVRQYAAEKLEMYPLEKQAVEDRFTAYYATFLQQRERRLKSSDQKEALLEIEADIENVRAACDLIFAQAKEVEIDPLLESLFFLYEIRGWLVEGDLTFGKAVTGLLHKVANWRELSRNQQFLLGRALVAQGRFCLRLSLFERADELLHWSLTIFEEIKEQRKKGYALINLAVYAFLLGDYATARQRLEAGVAVFRVVEDALGLGFALYSAGNAAMAAGDFNRARELFEESLLWHRQEGYKQGIATSLNLLGEISYRQESYSDAQRLFQESFLVRQDLDDRWGIATSLNSLGQVAFAQGVYDPAQQQYQESLHLFQEVGDRKGRATVLNNLGNLSTRLEFYQTAQEQFQESLYIASELHLVPLALDILCGIATLLTRIEKKEEAISILASVYHHSACDRHTFKRVECLLAELDINISSNTTTSFLETDQAEQVESIITRLLKTNLLALSIQR